MEERSLERLAASAGVIAIVAVGAPVLMATVLGDDPVIEGPIVWWWVSYLVFITGCLVDLSASPRRPRWLTDHRLLAILVAAAATAYLLDPHYGWSGVLLVVTAAYGAYTLSPRGSMGLVFAQSALIGATQLSIDISTADALMSALAYGSFQAFAVLVVVSERRERAARTELATAHAELRASSALLAESSRSVERLRIARDLHDLIGHQLTALSLDLEVASHHSDGTARRHVLRARHTAKGLLGDVRAAVADLRDPATGLTGPLHALVDGLTRPAVTLRVVEEVTVPPDLAVAVVRCVQEIVTNTLRHADADELWITVRATADGVTVEAGDDGRGTATLRPGHGLVGMRERVEQLGGEVRFVTAHGEGFRVAARVPTV